MLELESRRSSVDRPEAVVEFRNVTKSYDGESYALRNLTLAVRPGEFLTLLGPSGSGKTTTLLLLAGFELPTTGEILLEGRSVARVPPHRRNIGMVFQNYALFPHMRVIDNVAFPLSVRGLPRVKCYERAEHALRLVELDGLGQRRPQQLSGGQQQRTALARALVFEPSIVLMDEPFGALDKKLREQMQSEVRHIQRRLQSTMISVTHDQSEALTMSDRIAVFNKGELQQLATPRELYDRPANVFVANFIGETNTLSGKVDAISTGECRVILNTGQRIIATSSLGAAVPGREVVLSIRPEKLAINPGQANWTNVLTGVVRDVVYWGDHMRYTVETVEGAKLVIKANDAAMKCSSGDHVEVAWRAQDCLALRPD